METGNGKIFEHELWVAYAHVDQMGFVYYANYLVYFEMARSAFLREVGMPYSEFERRGVRLPVIEAHCEYKHPAHFDDRLVVKSRCTQVRRTRLHIDYEVSRGSELLATGYTEHVCLSEAGKVLRLVPELDGVLSAL